jgi:hypothetical protein
MKKKSSNAGPIAGGVVGGLAVVAAAVVAIFYFRSRQKRKTAANVSANGPGPFEDGAGGFTGTTDYITGQQKAELPTCESQFLGSEFPISVCCWS